MKSQGNTAVLSLPTATQAKIECTLCGDRGYTLEQRDGDWYAKECLCKKIKALHRLIESSGVTEKQREYSLDNYFPTRDTNGMYQIANQYINYFPGIQKSNAYNKGIGLMGTVGCGKTHLLLAIANALLNQNIPVIFVYVPDVIAELQQAQFERDEAKSLDTKIHKLGEVPVLILDDVGKEKITGWVQVQYSRIINQRYTRQLPTLFSSNYSLDQIAEMIGDHSASRLYSLTKERQSYVMADDYRITE